MKCTHCIVKEGVHASHFVDEYFHDCLYKCVPFLMLYLSKFGVGNTDWVSFTLQLVSILTWVLAQVPQFIDNWRNQSAEALSPWFLAEWFLGDTCNLVGCILTGVQLPLTTGTAWYFIMCDITMMVQYTYYSAIARRRALRAARHEKRIERLRSQRSAALTAQQALAEQDELNSQHGSGAPRGPPGEQLVSHIPRVHTTPHLDLVRDPAWQVHNMRMSAVQVPRSHYELYETDSLPTSTTHSGLERPQQREQRVVFTSSHRQTLTAAPSTPCPTAAQASTGVLLCLLVASAFVGGSWCDALRTRALEQEQPLHRTAPGAHALWLSTALAPTRTLAFQPPDLAKSRPQSGDPLAAGVAGQAFSQGAGQGWAARDDAGAQNLRLGTHRFPAPVQAGRALPGSGLDVEMLSRKRSELPMCKVIDAPPWAQWAGLALGMISACFYLKSRVSQIIKNVTRRNTDGLATSMFICAMVGNITGFGGIVLRTVTWRAVLWQMPWMLGMFGTVAMDALIAYQTVAFARAPPAPDIDGSSAPAGASASGNGLPSAGECCVPLLGGEDAATAGDGKHDTSVVHKGGPDDPT